MDGEVKPSERFPIGRTLSRVRFVFCWTVFVCRFPLGCDLVSAWIRVGDIGEGRMIRSMPASPIDRQALQVAHVQVVGRKRDSSNG